MKLSGQGPARFSAAGRSHRFPHLFPLHPKSIPHAACHRGLTLVTACHYPPWQLKCHLKDRKIFKTLLCTACFVCRGLESAAAGTAPGIQNHSFIKDKENGAKVNKQQENDKSPQLVLHTAGFNAEFSVCCHF